MATTVHVAPRLVVVQYIAVALLNIVVALFPEEVVLPNVTWSCDSFVFQYLSTSPLEEQNLVQ